MRGREIIVKNTLLNSTTHPSIKLPRLTTTNYRNHSTTTTIAITPTLTDTTTTTTSATKLQVSLPLPVQLQKLQIKPYKPLLQP